MTWPAVDCKHTKFEYSSRNLLLSISNRSPNIYRWWNLLSSTLSYRHAWKCSIRMDIIMHRCLVNPFPPPPPLLCEPNLLVYPSIFGHWLACWYFFSFPCASIYSDVWCVHMDVISWYACVLSRFIDILNISLPRSTELFRRKL